MDKLCNLLFSSDPSPIRPEVVLNHGPKLLSCSDRPRTTGLRGRDGQVGEEYHLEGI